MPNNLKSGYKFSPNDKPSFLEVGFNQPLNTSHFGHICIATLEDHVLFL